jgi:hypothetical protein
MGRLHVDDIVVILKIITKTRMRVTAICTCAATTVCVDLLSQVELIGTRSVVGWW